MLKSDAQETFRNEIVKRFKEGNAKELLSYLENAWVTTAASPNSYIRTGPSYRVSPSKAHGRVSTENEAKKVTGLSTSRCSEHENQSRHGEGVVLEESPPVVSLTDDEKSDVEDGQDYSNVKFESNDGVCEWDPLMLWICPSMDLLEDIAAQVRAEGLTAATSVGCGTGLLEWLLAALTGLHVTGLEVNRDWWACKFSPPTFIEHVYVDARESHLAQVDIDNSYSTEGDFDFNKDRLPQADGDPSSVAAKNGYVVPPTHALISCYFNNNHVFRSYLSLYRGPLVILIGSAGGLRNTEPSPLDLQHHRNWLLRCVRPVHRMMEDSDQMAVYTRRR